ncbi:MAG: hypothetical protein H6625_00800 [Bdellovibrionaceae bacterium]|nr:hypothetical protein [Pseudobdellovibrionaceae bacterium]
MSLKLKSTPPADESYSQRFIKSYQQCEEVFIANKKANKKLVQNYFSTPQNIDIIINVKKSGVIANVNIPLNTNSDFQYKKWMACLTKKTFQFQFPTLPKNIRYHLVLEAKINH